MKKLAAIFVLLLAFAITGCVTEAQMTRSMPKRFPGSRVVGQDQFDTHYIYFLCLPDGRLTYVRAQGIARLSVESLIDLDKSEKCAKPAVAP